MPNVGEVKTFTVAGAPPDGGGLTYVWGWWDSTVSVTTVPTVQKTLNVGGLTPLPVTCQYCDAEGQSATLNTSILVNSPPVIVGNPTITNNDLLFPFSTACEATAYDPEAAGPLAFGWWEGATYLGTGVTTIPTAGTYRNTYSTGSITANRTLTQKITDVDSGVTAVEYSLRGYAATGLTGGGASISNSIISATNNLGEVVIGPGQTVTFSAYALDDNSGALQFTWELLAVNGWVADYTTVDLPAQLPNGSYRSQVIRSVSGEQPGLKMALCTVRNVATGEEISLRQTVQLNASRTPVVRGILTDAPLVSGAYSILRTQSVSFTGTATDANNLLLNYRWDFTEPPGLQLWGKTVLIRPDQHAYYDQSVLTSGPRSVSGQLTVFDRFGATAAVSIQSYVTVQVWKTP